MCKRMVSWVLAMALCSVFPGATNVRASSGSTPTVVAARTAVLAGSPAGPIAGGDAGTNNGDADGVAGIGKDPMPGLSRASRVERVLLWLRTAFLWGFFIGR